MPWPHYRWRWYVNATLQPLYPKQNIISINSTEGWVGQSASLDTHNQSSNSKLTNPQQVSTSTTLSWSHILLIIVTEYQLKLVFSNNGHFT